jgi:DeoR family transcriptional regulator of aga operon
MLSTTERRYEIIRLISEQGKVEVDELSEKLGVSKVTIRTDLNYLKDRGLVYRTHGGALTQSIIAFDTDFIEKRKIHSDQKKRIGIAAAEMINDEESVILDSGTTTIEIAKNIKDKNLLNIMTNSINIAQELSGHSNTTVTLTGGILREKSHSLVGPHAEQAFNGLFFDKLFLAVDGFDIEYGLTTPNYLEAQLNKLMVEHSQETIVVVDSSKFKQRSFSLIIMPDYIHKVITDDIPDDYRKTLESLNIEVLIA